MVDDSGGGDDDDDDGFESWSAVVEPTVTLPWIYQIDVLVMTC